MIPPAVFGHAQEAQIAGWLTCYLSETPPCSGHEEAAPGQEGIGMFKSQGSIAIERLSVHPYIFCYVNREIPGITLGPPLFPKAGGNLGHLIQKRSQGVIIRNHIATFLS
jgi:hypothetical protein